MKLDQIKATSWVIILAWLLMATGIASWAEIEPHIKLLGIGGMTAVVAIVQVLAKWSQTRKDNKLGVVEIIVLVFVIPNLIAGILMAAVGLSSN